MAIQHFEPLHFSNLKDKIDGKTPLFGALLAFSFLFTFLFIYFLYICTQRRGTDMIGGGNSNSPPARATGLDPATISRGLHIFSFGSSHKKPSPGAECSICLSLFQEGERSRVLTLCSHGFHSDCVDKWLRTRSSFRLCRACIHPVRDGARI